MAGKSRAQFQKRQKELARQEKQKDKMARRLLAKERKSLEDPTAADGNPDTAGSPSDDDPAPEDP